MGYLPETMRNYLLRLGWSHGDDEIISTAQAIEWFNLESIGKSAARMDYKKLDNLNGHYIREHADDSGGGSHRLPGARDAAARACP
jgi:glutamyl-tRNA synthetase